MPSRNRRPTPRQRQDATRYLTALQQTITDPTRVEAAIQSCQRNGLIYKRYGLEAEFNTLVLLLQFDKIETATGIIDRMKEKLV